MSHLASVPAFERLYVGNGDKIQDKDYVEFRLLFEGQLPPSGGSNTRPAEKHGIRRALHPQLRRLWSVKKDLRGLAHHEWFRRNLNASIPTGDRSADGIKIIGDNWDRFGFKFVPLVTAELALRCSLHITLLRPDEERFIFRRGDLDGQLKTIFDALRMPSNLAEAGGIGPQRDEDPFFVLLEDDRLISEVHVIEDQMLLLPNQREVNANDAHAIIHVRLNHKGRTTNDWFA